VKQYHHNNARNSYNHNDDDDIQILEDYCTVRPKIIFYPILCMN
jgi:hypothetical protein